MPQRVALREMFVPLVQASLTQLALLSARSVWLGCALWRIESRLSRRVGW